MGEAELHILLVEDEPNFGDLLKNYLELSGYRITLCRNGTQGLSKFRTGSFDLCVLDVMMPQKDGFTLAEEIRAINEQVPLIFLTARKLKEDVLKGFKLGADDYITKPFDSEVLLYKLKAILKRQSIQLDTKQEAFEIGKYEFDFKLRTISKGKQSHKLSPKEAQLLRVLCQFKGDVMPRELALKHIWKEENYFTARSMDVYIAKLRKLFKEDNSVQIVNVHGDGYRLVVE